MQQYNIKRSNNNNQREDVQSCSACGDEDNGKDLNGDICGADVRLFALLGGVPIVVVLGSPGLVRVVKLLLSRFNGDTDVGEPRSPILDCRCRC